MWTLQLLNGKKRTEIVFASGAKIAARWNLITRSGGSQFPVIILIAQNDIEFSCISGNRNL